jgi:hypothetical protein
MAVAKAEPPLQYARPATRRGGNAKLPLYIAFACGLTPAVLGTAIIVAWLFTRYGGFEALGLANILLGLACTLVGGAALLIHFWRARETGRPRRSWLLPGVIAGTILIGNFPLCGYYLWVADLYTVAVVNATGAPVSSFVVTDPLRQSWEFGPIPAGGRVSRMIDAEGEGAVVFSANCIGGVVAGEVDGYITNGMSNDRRTVTLNRDGSYTVR